jgi:hypothetical protein
MNCFYHKNEQAIVTCMQCNLSLCSECCHSEYIEYCWECGLKYKNKRIDNTNNIKIKLPRILQNRIIEYTLYKLAAAGGSWISFALLAGLFSLFIGMDEITGLLIYIAIVTIIIVYTYGIFSSLLTDGIVKLFKIDNWYIPAIIHLAFGMIFPWVWYMIAEKEFVFSNYMNMIFGGIVSILYFAILQIKIKELIYLIALMPLVVGVIIVFSIIL